MRKHINPRTDPVQWTQDRHSNATQRHSAYTYDGFGRVTVARDHRGGITRTVYNALGQVEKSIDTLGRPTIYTYFPSDAIGAGRVSTVTKPDRTTSTYTFSARGEILTIGGTSEYPQTFTYNDYGDRETLITTNAAGSSVTRWEYNNAGLLKSKFYAWAPGQPNTTPGTVNYSYDPFGRLLFQAVAGGKTTAYKYNLFGEVYEIDYGNDGPADVLIARDDAGQPEVVTENYEGADNTQLGSGTTTHSYIGGRLDSVEYHANHPFLPGVKLDYRARQAGIGRPTGYDVMVGTAPYEQVSYSYDTSGRLEIVSAAHSGTFEYRYHPGSGIVAGYTGRNTYGSSVVFDQKRSVDFQNRTAAVTTRNGSGTDAQVLSSVAYSYDRQDRRTQARREDGSYWKYGYNTRGEVVSGKRHTAGGSAINGLERGYQYDLIGNREWAKFGGGDSGALTQIGYTANGYNEYASIDHPGKAWLVGQAPEAQQVTVNGIAADRQGTWFSRELTAANSTVPVALPVTVNESPEKTGKLLLPKKVVAPIHDKAGNLVNDGKWIYEWDSANRLRKMSVTAAALNAGYPYRSFSFVYDWQGRRIAKINGTGSVHTRYLYDGWNVVAEFSNVTSPSSLPRPQTYLWGLDLAGQASGNVSQMQGAGGVGGLLAVNVVKNGTSLGRVFPSYDGNGNILTYSGSDGLLKQSQDYDPFGNVVLKRNYAGPLAANQGQVDYGFSTKPEDRETGLLYYGYRYYDPVTGRWPSRDPIEERGGVNLYGFVGNDGVNRLDMLGLWFADGVTRFGEKSHGIQLDGKGTLAKSMIGSASAVQNMHEDTHIYQISGGADPRGAGAQPAITGGPVKNWNAIPYKQLFWCCQFKDSVPNVAKNGWCYFKNDGTKIAPSFKIKLQKDKEDDLWEMGKALFPSKWHELGDLEVPVITWEISQTTDPRQITVLKNYRTQMQGYVGNQTENPVWTAYKKAYEDEKGKYEAAGLTWKWKLPNNVYSEIK